MSIPKGYRVVWKDKGPADVDWSRWNPSGGDGVPFAPSVRRMPPARVAARLKVVADAPEVLVVMSADHIYRFDVMDAVATHRRTGAECTIVTTTVPVEEATDHATVKSDADGTVTLDFTRAANLPCSFTDYATCPVAPAAAGPSRPDRPGVGGDCYSSATERAPDGAPPETGTTDDAGGTVGPWANWD